MYFWIASNRVFLTSENKQWNKDTTGEIKDSIELWDSQYIPPLIIWGLFSDKQWSQQLFLLSFRHKSCEEAFCWLIYILLWSQYQQFLELFDRLPSRLCMFGSKGDLIDIMLRCWPRGAEFLFNNVLPPLPP